MFALVLRRNRGGLFFSPLSDESQTIFKVHREERNRFAMIANSTIKDDRLSFKSTGLLCYLLSLPEDWQVSQGHLSTVKKDGRDSVIAGFKELQNCGYIEKQYLRNDAGQIQTTIWHVFELPKEVLPKSEKPKSGSPISENPTLQKTEENKETKKQTVAGAPVDEPSIQSKVVSVPPELDSDEFVSAFDRWIANRRQRRIKPYTVDGANAQLKILAVIGQARAIAAIEWSIAQGYQGIYEEKSSNNNRKSLTASHSNAGTSNASAASQY